MEDRIELGAYQFMYSQPIEHDQYEPGTLKIVLQTAMNEAFVNHSVTAILQPEAQAKIVRHFLSSVMTEDEFTNLITEAERGAYDHLSLNGTLLAGDPDDVKKRREDYAESIIKLVRRLKLWIRTPAMEPY